MLFFLVLGLMFLGLGLFFFGMVVMVFGGVGIFCFWGSVNFVRMMFLLIWVYI